MADEPTKSCVKCGALIGRLEVVAGVELLKVNGIIVRSLHGACCNCGAEFHWSTSDKIIGELMQIVKKWEGGIS